MQFDQQTILIVAAVVAGLIIIALIAASVRRARSARLREHFGSEYDHVVEAKRSRTAAEEELVQRAEEVKSFDIRPLTAAERQAFVRDWKRIETRFIERPTTAVVEADELITSVMTTRGYPMADFEKHAAHLSVKHPRVVDHYRAGHHTIDEHARGSASTEDLRQAMLHYRALFEELVNDGVDVAQDVPVTREVAEDRPRAFVSTTEERPEARR